MFTNNKKINKDGRGFSLLELVLAVGIFATASIAIGYLIIDSNNTIDINSKKIQTNFLAKEGIEAVRSIRDAGGFTAISDTSEHAGAHGLSFATSTGIWSFSGTSDTSGGVYTRIITLGAFDSHTEIATSTVTATSSTGKLISTSLTTRFTNWR